MPMSRIPRSKAITFVVEERFPDRSPQWFRRRWLTPTSWFDETAQPYLGKVPITQEEFERVYAAYESSGGETEPAIIHYSTVDAHEKPPAGKLAGVGRFTHAGAH